MITRDELFTHALDFYGAQPVLDDQHPAGLPIPPAGLAVAAFDNREAVGGPGFSGDLLQQEQEL